MTLIRPRPYRPYGIIAQHHNRDPRYALTLLVYIVVAIRGMPMRQGRLRLCMWYPLHDGEVLQGVLIYPDTSNARGTQGIHKGYTFDKPVNNLPQSCCLDESN